MSFKLLFCLCTTFGLMAILSVNSYVNAQFNKDESTTSTNSLNSESIESASSVSADSTTVADPTPDASDESDVSSDSDTDDSAQIGSDSKSSRYSAYIVDEDLLTERIYVGRHKHNRGSKDQQTESHHIISSHLCALLGLNVNNAPSVCLSHRLHIRTGSYGQSASAAAYRKEEQEKLFDAMRKDLSLFSETDENLIKIFKVLPPESKYNYLLPVLKFGLEDLKGKLDIHLERDPACITKSDVELKRLVGLDDSTRSNPLYTPNRKSSLRPNILRRKSSTGTTEPQSPTADHSSSYTPFFKRRKLEDEYSDRRSDQTELRDSIPRLLNLDDTTSDDEAFEKAG